MVAHNADGLNAGQDREELGHFLFIPGAGGLVAQDGVRLLQDGDAPGRDFPDHTNAQARSRKGLAPDKVCREAKLLADLSHLILKQQPQRLDDTEKLDVVGLFYFVVVGLDRVGVTLAALDKVGVDRALGKVAVLVFLPDDIPEDPVEFPADRLALVLRVGQALEGKEELVSRVHADKVHVKQAGEGLLHQVPLVLAHQAVVHEDAGQLPADGAGEECGRNARVDAAGKTEDDALVTDLLPQGGDGLFDEAVHFPLALAAADGKEEILQQFAPVDGVGDLRMELDRVEGFCCVFHGCAGAGGRRGGDGKAIGHRRDVIRVAHPADALFRDVSEEQAAGLFHGHFHPAVLAGGRVGDDAAAHPGHELGAVADPEDRDAQRKDILRVVGG